MTFDEMAAWATVSFVALIAIFWVLQKIGDMFDAHIDGDCRIDPVDDEGDHEN